MALKLKTKLSKSLMIDTLIAAVISDYAPGLINKFLFSSNPLSGYTLQAAGAGAVYVAGALMKKPNVASVGVALAGANLVSGMLGGVLSPMVATPTKNVLTTQKNADVLNSMADYISLNDYVSFPKKAAGYSKFYE